MTEILTILQCTVIMNECIFLYGILSNVSKELNISEKNHWDMKSYATRGIGAFEAVSQKPNLIFILRMVIKMFIPHALQMPFKVQRMTMIIVTNS